MDPFKLIWLNKVTLRAGVAFDIKRQFSGLLLGGFWALLFPMVQLSIYCVLYVFIFRVRPPGLEQWSYVILVFSGLVPILAFSQALLGGMSALNANNLSVSNGPNAPVLIVLRSVLANQYSMMLGMLIVIFLSLISGLTSPWLVIGFIPILWVALIMFAVGICWVLSLVSVIARDIQQTVALILMAMTFLSPFAYTAEMVPEPLKLILYINPFSYFVRSFQDVLSYGTYPDLIQGSVSLVIGLSVFYLGFNIFQKQKQVFLDYV